MKLGLSLLDKASKVCGSDSELARRLGVHRVFVAQMRSEKVKISPSTAAELADIAGEDAREAAINSLIENAKGTRREGVLREVLGKVLAVGVAGVLAFSYSGDLILSTDGKQANENEVDNIYIVECIKAFFRLFKASSFADRLNRFKSAALIDWPTLHIDRL